MNKTIALASLIVSVIVFFFALKKDSKIYYIDTIRIYDESSFKKDMYSKLEKEFAGQTHLLDSIAAIVKISPNDEVLNNEFERSRREVMSNYTESEKKSREKIWERLNTWIQEFGKQKEANIIIGANGMGTVLYGAEKIDLTDDAIQFINKRYSDEQ